MLHVIDFLQWRTERDGELLVAWSSADSKTTSHARIPDLHNDLLQ